MTNAERGPRVTGLHRLALRVPSLPRTGDFYQQAWGMELAASDGDTRYFRAPSAANSELCLQSGAEAALDHLALTVPRREDLQPLLEPLARLGFSVTRAPGPGRHPDDAASAEVTDPDGNRVELVVPQSSAAEPTAGRKKLGHVVLWTPQPDAMEAFYLLLGFRVSDRTAMGMSFLRCCTDHHSVALVRSAGRTGLQHAAFDVGTIDAVMRELGNLRRKDVACVWGPGRHGPGNNIFTYYRDPAGNVVEFYGDLERVKDDGEPLDVRYWGPEHGGDVWGIAGPQPAPFRS